MIRGFQKHLSILFILCFFDIASATPVKGEKVLMVSLSADTNEVERVESTVSSQAVIRKVKIRPWSQRKLSAYLNHEFSYAETLEMLVDGAIAFDQRTGFNPYHFIDWRQQPSKNTFVYEYVAFRNVAPRDLLEGEPRMISADSVSLDKQGTNGLNSKISIDWQIVKAAKNNLLLNHPDLVVCHWDNLPDPPAMVDTVFLPLISEIDLGYKHDRNLVKKDYKIETFKQSVSPWTFKGLSSLHTNETFVSYWDKGGQNSFSILGVVNFDADYNIKDLKWENSFEVKLGGLYQEDDELRKNADAFKINSKVGYRAIKNWYYTMSLDVNSQFFKGYDKKEEKTRISNFLSPANIFLSIGMDYKYKKLFSVFISPLTYKNTLVLDTAHIDASKFGVPKGDRSKKEVGGYVRGSIKWPINEDMTLTSKIYLFSNYVDKAKNVDVDFENDFDYNFSHVFSLRLSMDFKYDDDTKLHVGDNPDGSKKYGARLQFMQQMSIGLFYRF